MSKVIEYLEKEYEAKGWPYFNGMKLKFMFGEEGRNDILKLIEEGKARKVPGINGTLIELIKDTQTLKTDENEDKGVFQEPTKDQ